MPSSTPAVRPPRPLHPLPAWLALGAALGLAACGAPSAEAPPSKAGGAALTDADSALAELNRAEGEISSLLGPTPAQGAAPPPEATAAASATPALQPADGPLAGQQKPEARQQATALGEGPAPDACSIACRALASMERAASHLCGLSGEGDPSCTNARERVKTATDRVSARCPCSR
jgi:hypothetical protein